VWNGVRRRSILSQVRSQPDGIRSSDGHGASGKQRRSRGKCGDKRPFVRFHAAQSIVVFGALTILRIGLGIIMGIGGFVGFGLWALISMVLGLLGVILWILLMIKAYQHELFRVPIAAPIADGIAGK
jgi:uncharacterized membrane protein